MSNVPLDADPFETSEPAPMNRPGPTPPTVPGRPETLSQPPQWPTVLGVIALVCSGGGILVYAWGIVSMLRMGRFFQSMAQAMQAPEMPEEFVPINVATSGLNLIAAVLLLPAGIGLLKRRLWGIKLTRIWAVAKMLLAIVVAGLTCFMQEKMWTVMSQQNPALPQSSAMKQAFVGVVVVFTLAWGWALPVFMLIFLSRHRIREQIKTWS